QYDGEGQRVRQRSPDGVTTLFIGDLYERVSSNFHKFHVRLGNRVVAQVSWTESGKAILGRKILYLHCDHLGSVELVTDASGKVVERLKYDPFGAPINPTSLGASQKEISRIGIGFTGHRQERELGLIDMRARWFDPALGRFLSPDPIGPSHYSGQALNRYS